MYTLDNDVIYRFVDKARIVHQYLALLANPTSTTLKTLIF
jgi:hypothetical protein